MIKLIAFDLVGVLVREKDVELTFEEDKLERMFGPNINDSDYLKAARNIISKDSVLIRTTEELIDKIYEVKDIDLFEKIKSKYNNLQIIIATNHISFVRNFIGESFDVNYLDDLLISAEIHKIKPNVDFYEHIIRKYNILPEEVLFLDDSQVNIDGAKKVGMNTIKVTKDMDLFEEICKFMDLN